MEDKNLEKKLDGELEEVTGGVKIAYPDGVYEHAILTKEGSDFGFICSNCHYFVKLTLTQFQRDDYGFCPHCNTNVPLHRPIA